MFVSVCVSLCVFLCLYYIYMYDANNVCVRVCIYIWCKFCVCVCVHVCVCVQCVCVCVCVCVHVCFCFSVRLCVCVCVHLFFLCVCVCVRVCVYICFLHMVNVTWHWCLWAGCCTRTRRVSWSTSRYSRGYKMSSSTSAGKTSKEHWKTHSLKPVLNWANVCSPNILRTLRRTMIHFLIELLVRRIWFGQSKLYFILNWLVMRCKLRPELAADVQQTAW